MHGKWYTSNKWESSNPHTIIIALINHLVIYNDEPPLFKHVSCHALGL